MNTPNFIRVLVLVIAVIAPPHGWSASPAQLTYQGRLKVAGGMPEPGQSFDLRLRLCNAAAGGSVLDEAAFQSVAVDSDGLFTLLIDASPIWSSSFETHWVELDVRRSGTPDNYVTLAPRQRITAAPEALRARRAELAEGLSGPLPAAQLPPNAARLDQPQTFTAAPMFMPSSGPPFTVGITTTVQQLSADLLDGLDSAAFWRRDTNGGVSRINNPEDTPMELRSQNNRLLRLQPGALAPSLIGGSAANTITQTVSGSVIAGGGSMASPNSIDSRGAFVGAGRGNLIKTDADYAVLGGGDGNEIGIGAYDSVIGGGSRQSIGQNAIYAGILGGYNNVVSSEARFAGILLGNGGRVEKNSDFSLVVSGDDNAIGPQTPHAAILSGAANRIESSASMSLIGSGQRNLISTGATHSAVMAGELNNVGNNAQHSFVGGGKFNSIGSFADHAFIGGGLNNSIGPWAYKASIGGGEDNRVDTNSISATIAGGWKNRIQYGARYATISGGIDNHIDNGTPYDGGAATIGGGRVNSIRFADFATIGGGEINGIHSNANHATIGGGQRNSVGSNARFATIPGGHEAKAFNYGQHAYASGSFQLPGDAQTSTYVLRYETQRVGLSELYLSGNFAGSERMALPSDSAWTFDIIIIAASNIEYAGYQIRGVIANFGGLVSLLGEPVKTILYEADADWDAFVEADVENAALVIKVRSEANVRWVASVRTVEVIN